MLRLTINLTQRGADSMVQAAKLSGDTTTDVINRALTIYAYLEQVRADGGAVYVRSSTQEEITQLVVF